MIYTNEQKKEARDKLKAIGYKLSVKTSHSPFSGNAFEFISIVSPEGKKISCSDCDVMSVEFYNKHKAAFEIVTSIFKDLAPKDLAQAAILS